MSKPLTLTRKKKADVRPAAATRATQPMRVDLIPPSVILERSQATVRRLLLLGLVGLIAVVAVASIAVGITAAIAENDLAQQRTTAQTLAAQQAKYSSVTVIQGQLSDYQNAQLTALYPDVDWAGVTREMKKALPSGVSLSTLTISVPAIDTAGGGSTTTAAGAATGVVQIGFTLTSNTFKPSSTVLRNLPKLTGYQNAYISNNASSSNDSYQYTGTVLLDATAIGTTARGKLLDKDLVAPLHDELTQLAQGTSAGTSSASASTSGGN